jgi:hypothetical protein
MNTAGRVKQGFYFDSVTLMRVGRELSGLPGVAEASVVMATEANKSILAMSDLLLPEFKKCGDQDLAIVVRAKDARPPTTPRKAEEMLSARKARPPAAPRPRPRRARPRLRRRPAPGANLALISVAGRYAAPRGPQGPRKRPPRHAVPDNVSLATNRPEKTRPQEGLLVMGPTAGPPSSTAFRWPSPTSCPKAHRHRRPSAPARRKSPASSPTKLRRLPGHRAPAPATSRTDGRRIAFLDALQALANDRDTR